MGELSGTRIADPSGFAASALTTAILLPPAAANTGGASPTDPTSIDPAPIACSLGGPEVKSDQATLKGSLPIRPAAVSSDCAPDPAWSPTCSVTSDMLTGWAGAGGLSEADGDEFVPAEVAGADEQAVAAAPVASRPAASKVRRALVFIGFLPHRRQARRAGGYATDRARPGYAAGSPAPGTSS